MLALVAAPALAADVLPLTAAQKKNLGVVTAAAAAMAGLTRGVRPPAP